MLQLENECANELVETGKDGIPVSIASGFAKYDSNKDSKFVDVFNRADDEMYKNKRKKKRKSIMAHCLVRNLKSVNNATMYALN